MDSSWHPIELFECDPDLALDVWDEECGEEDEEEEYTRYGKSYACGNDTESQRQWKEEFEKAIDKCNKLPFSDGAEYHNYYPYVFLDSRWLLNFEGPRLPKRQDLPPEAYLPPDSYDTNNDEIPILALSYMWLSPDHPDPQGITLEKVKDAVRFQLSYGRLRPYRNHRAVAGLFWDYSSLYQNPRSKYEEDVFRMGLDVLPYLYMDPGTIVLQLTEHPEVCTDKAHNRLPYWDRGWPFTEECWCNLRAEIDGKVFHIPSKPKSLFGRRPPLLPEAYESLVEKKSFTNGFTDCPRLVVLYKVVFPKFAKKLQICDFTGLGMTHAQLRSFSQLFEEHYFPSVRCVRLDNNPCIGDEGAADLCAFLMIRGVVLSCTNIGLTQKGCFIVREKLREQEHSYFACRLKRLYLGQNYIGDVGVEFLSGLFLRCWEVSLVDVGMSNNGVKIIAELCEKNVPSFDVYLRVLRLNKGFDTELLETINNHGSRWCDEVGKVDPS